MYDERLPRPARGRKKKGKAACMDLRRGIFNCGICGSENLIKHRHIFCDACWEEYVHDVFWADRVAYMTWLQMPRRRDCECEIELSADDIYYYAGRLSSATLLIECADCGAVQGPHCPNCGRTAWGKNEKLNCRRCGFQREALCPKQREP